MTLLKEFVNVTKITHLDIIPEIYKTLLQRNIGPCNIWNQFLVTDKDSHVKKCFQTRY